MAKTLLGFFNPAGVEAGCDEAGRGCLAGPVFAAAVILTKDFYHPLLSDSKQLTEKEREFLRPIIEREARAWAVASADAAEIDKINILNASILSMHRALDKLIIKPDLILVDGNRFKPWGETRHLCITGGDGKYASIAAASVLAKSYRDEFMRKIAQEYPMYGWDKNMAYPTKFHREAIRESGISPYHRKTFRLL